MGNDLDHQTYAGHRDHLIGILLELENPLPRFCGIPGKFFTHLFKLGDDLSLVFIGRSGERANCFLHPLFEGFRTRPQ